MSKDQMPRVWPGRLAVAMGTTTFRSNARIISALDDSARRYKRALEGTIHAIAMVAEMRDPYTAGHERRVAKLSQSIACEMSFSCDQVEGVYLSATIHDIGKIAIPAEILAKPCALSEIEFNLMKTHPRVGYDILKSVEFPWPVAEVLVQHHERMDGSGYPQKLKGEEISMSSRIVAVADVVEGMSNHRPYRPALGIEKALEEISGSRGIKYDPDVVDICIHLFEKKDFKFS